MRYIALLRGINVGGHKKFVKAAQLHMLSNLNYKNPQVYIHTGNWIFESKKKPATLALEISKAITTTYGWQVPVLVISVKEFETLFFECPFSEEKKEQSYFTLLSEIPLKEHATIFNDTYFPEEEFLLKNSCVYFYSTKSSARVKLNNNFMERKLNVSATSRNFKTMTKILALAEA